MVHGRLRLPRRFFRAFQQRLHQPRAGSISRHRRSIKGRPVNWRVQCARYQATAAGGTSSAIATYDDRLGTCASPLPETGFGASVAFSAARDGNDHEEDSDDATPGIGASSRRVSFAAVAINKLGWIAFDLRGKPATDQLAGLVIRSLSWPTVRWLVARWGAHPGVAWASAGVDEPFGEMIEIRKRRAADLSNHRGV